MEGNVNNYEVYEDILRKLGKLTMPEQEYIFTDGIRPGEVITSSSGIVNVRYNFIHPGNYHALYGNIILNAQQTENEDIRSELQREAEKLKAAFEGYTKKKGGETDGSKG
jgi:hypothetical protein